MLAALVYKPLAEKNSSCFKRNHRWCCWNFEIEDSFEDVHSKIEYLLTEN
jgi:hypothetical protein